MSTGGAAGAAGGATFGLEVAPIRNVLLSLSDRAGAVELARALVAAGATLWATEGTARALGEAGLLVRPVSDLVGQGAWLGGRVKTLHPALLGGVLARRDVPADLVDLDERGVPPLDLVVVSLYPFEQLPPGADWPTLVETIDVGGVTLLRAAAKNVRDVAVLSSPDQYAGAIAALTAEGGVPRDLRCAWAQAAFERTARYDAAIAAAFAARAGGDGAPADQPPATWAPAFNRVRTLRYGENPHQAAALYAAPGAGTGGATTTQAVVEGKELSYNNLLDVAAAASLVGEFPGIACAIVKHNEPAGVARGDGARSAFSRAFEADALSAFGGVVAFNSEVDRDCALALAEPFLECVAAPSFTGGALEALAAKKNLRLVRIAPGTPAPRWEARAVGDALLVQGERGDAPALRLEVVSRRAPTPEEMEALLFAWTVVAHARSNAIVIARADRTLGIGAGKTSRIDAVEVALLKARRSGHDTTGAVLASDGFFPFADWVAPAHAAGVTACIQPGGSLRDPESIAACDEAGLALVLTGRRLFRH
ncbi:MAG: bifunctional phosphoribosylaminoimidazolecarboxamide formyltransferase/IMP cyclohydrolase [Candidatus Eisenbacteria bacterium]